MSGTKEEAAKRVLVAGGGVAGAAVGIFLDRAGVETHIIEKQGYIGGHAAAMGCKATDECLRCNVCVANDFLKKAVKAQNVKIHTNSTLKRIENGQAMRFTAIIEHQNRYIDPDKCCGCGLCIPAAPGGSISIPYPWINNKAVVADRAAWEKASEKKRAACAAKCPAGAIDVNAEKCESKIDVDCVVLANGYEEYDPIENTSYGYGRVKNIITGMEAEKILGREEQITRPSDGQVPSKVAFVQCVGSRTEEIHRRCEEGNYCSAVCCSYALRISQKIQYMAPDTEVSIFYMDIQNFGKDFDEFYAKCKSSVRFVRSRPYELSEGENGQVIVTYSPNGEQGAKVCRDEFGLVILSIGIRPGEDNREFGDKLKVGIDEYGFLGVSNLSGIADMQRAGFYVVGGAEGPKDIAGSIAQAQAVCAVIIDEAKR